MSTAEKTFYLPIPGQRIIRSVCAVCMCFVIYFLRGKEGIPFYSALAALQCMQPYQESSLKMAKQRTVGTLVGAFWGLLVILLEMYAMRADLFGSLLHYVLISIFTGVVIYSTVLLGCQNTAYFSSVVFLCITVAHMSDANPFLFAANRVIDTMVGVVVALFVNAVHLPRRKRTDILFVSGLDDTILTKEKELNSYSKIELNRLIEQGLNFTVSTRRTPADIREMLAGVKMKLPVIAMDGAVLYDIGENSYPETCGMDHQQSKRILRVLEEMGVSSFAVAVSDDLMAIYYQTLSNEAQEKIYEKTHRSPYRNFVRRSLPEDEGAVCFIMIEKKETAEEVCGTLSEQPWISDYRIVSCDSVEYPGYAYIKIFNRDATRENMLKVLCQMLRIDRTVTFGSVKGEYDVYIQGSDRNEAVKELKKRFEPVVWKSQGIVW